MGRSQDVLIGRDPELRVFERLLTDACAGAPRSLFLTGEPGIGKTHLLAELARRAEGRGCLVLEGRAAEFEQELPFGVVIDALDAYVQSLEPRSVDRLAVDGLEELAEVFPSLRSLRSSTWSPSSAAERFRAYYAVRDLLERLTAQQPLVLIVDDLHWADTASLELMAHLLRRPPDAPILLAGSYRTGQGAPGLLLAIDAADRSGEVERLEVGPLDAGEAALLLSGSDAATRDRLYRQSGGNPFYLLQLARVAPTGPGLARDESDQVPPAVTAAIAHELDALSPLTRAFCEAAAVVGDPFELEVAMATGDVTEPLALAALDELIARDLVRPAAVPRRFRFRHPLVRNAVYASSSTSRRLTAHARCAEALAAQGWPATARASHIENSARRGDPAAVQVLLEAGRATTAQMPSVAARWFQSALRLLPEDAASDERVQVMTATAAVLAAGGRLEEARSVLLEALALAAEHDVRVRIIATCAGVEQQLGRQDEAHHRLLGGLEELTDRATEPGVALMVALATDGFYRNDFESMQEWGRAAVTAAPALGNRSLTAAAEAVLALACAFTGAVDEAQVHRRAAAALVDAMPDGELALRLDAIGHLAGTELYLERFEETAAHAARGIAVARAVGHDAAFPTMFPCLGTSLWVLGRLAESDEVLEGAVESARLSGNAQGLAWSLFNRAIGAIMAGEIEGARTFGDEAFALSPMLGDTFVASYVGIMQSWVRFESGDPTTGVELLVEAGGGEDLSRIAGGWRATHLEVLARCWLALGRLDRAELAAERARAVAGMVQLPRTCAMAYKATAEVALYAGDTATAVEQACASVEAAETVAARVDAALSRVLLGRALAAAGERTLAVTELERAAADLESFGATRWRDEAEQELRKLGHRIHRRSQPGKAHAGGIDSLSGRELEVVRLVVDRRTNVEIARELFLSLRTVETHLRNIFRKLGCPRVPRPPVSSSGRQLRSPASLRRRDEAEPGHADSGQWLCAVLGRGRTATEEDQMSSRLNPYISFNGNARAALDFYVEVFGGTLALNTFGEFGAAEGPAADKIMHGQLDTASGFTLMGSDTPPGMEHSPGNTMAVSLSGDDADDLRGYWDKLSAAGTVTMPLERQMWGDEFGMCIDQFGVPWMVNITQTAPA